MKKPISDTVRSAVAAAQIGADRVTLTGQLGRAEYVAVNELLARIGGKWNKKAGAHLFDRDPRPLLEEALGAGVLPEKNPLCFYETPDTLLDMIFGRIDMPALHKGNQFRMLEPSAGNGSIVNRLCRECERLDISDYVLSAVEIDPIRRERLARGRNGVHCGDFLTWTPQYLAYDLIVMNPPFTAPGQPTVGLDHVKRGFELLAPWGLLVAILPSGWTSRDDSKHSAFRALVERHGYWIDNPDGSFHASGTDVNTTTVFLRKEGIGIAKRGTEASKP